LPSDHPYYRQFRDDVEFVLQACARHSLQLFPSLIDFRWCHQGIAIGGGTGIIQGGRYDIIRDPEKRRAFFDRALDPLLEAAVAYRDSIYAWELVNEPEWAVREFSLLRKKEGNCTVPLRAMKAFIAEGIRRINGKLLPDGRRAFHSSVGFAHWKSLETWDSGKLGITLHQFHYYAQKDSGLPPYPGEANHPCVIGEFATAEEHDWPDLKGRQQDQTVANRLGCLEEKGYPACFLWSARAADAATRWTADEQEEVSAYTGFNRPKPVA